MASCRQTLYKLRTGLRMGGAKWLYERIRREWAMPTTTPGRWVYRKLRAAGAAFRPAPDAGALSSAGTASDTLYAFYDLAVAPVTFDFLWFLVGADLARRRRGLSAIHMIIAPGPVDGLRKEHADYERVIDRAARRSRIHNIFLPACALLPSVSGTTVASSREQAEQLFRLAGENVYPSGYEPALPIYSNPQPCLDAARRERAAIGTLRATRIDLQTVERWLRARGCERRVVTVTFRSYGYMPARNSNMAAWVAFARRLDRTRFSPVIIPDTDQTLDVLPPELADFPVFSEAAWNLGLRMALYERAYLNLGINNGPVGLCWLNDRTRYVTFKILTGGVPQASPEYVSSLGFELGQSLPFATPWQKWVWEDDDLPVIEREFEDMVRRMDEGLAAPTPEHRDQDRVGDMERQFGTR